jgi:hypothetical protein
MYRAIVANDDSVHETLVTVIADDSTQARKMVRGRLEHEDRLEELQDWLEQGERLILPIKGYCVE